MISWNLFFALHKIHTTHRIPGDFSRLRLKVEKFLFASFCTHKRLFAHNMYKYKGIFFGLHISVWLQFKSYVNVRRLLKILFLQYFFHHIPHSSNNYKCAYYLFMLHNDQNPHQLFHNIFVISLEYLRNAIKHFYSTSSFNCLLQIHDYLWFEIYLTKLNS